MKNIHVIQTDKPSRIYLIKSNNKLGITSNNPEFTENFGSGTQNQHIYITSDEEIKKGDFFYSVRGHIEKAIINYPKGEHFGKLILTTDQNLIKYGVQAIDDEFLEWFVKNPSCEEVEVSYEVLKPFQGEEKGYLIHCPDNEVLEEPKQEKLKEAAEKWFNKDGFYPNPKQGFISGAKWQAKKGYSEEDLEKAFKVGFTLGYGSDVEAIDEKDKCFNRWFKIFKNK